MLQYLVFGSCYTRSLVCSFHQVWLGCWQSMRHASSHCQCWGLELAQCAAPLTLGLVLYILKAQLSLRVSLARCQWCGPVLQVEPLAPAVCYPLFYIGLKTIAIIKYHSWLEVRIFINGNERLQSQNRIEALNKNWKAVKQERGLTEVTRRSRHNQPRAESRYWKHLITTEFWNYWLGNVVWWDAIIIIIIIIFRPSVNIIPREF